MMKKKIAMGRKQPMNLAKATRKTVLATPKPMGVPITMPLKRSIQPVSSPFQRRRVLKGNTYAAKYSQ
jgi:hypothetical protein